MLVSYLYTFHLKNENLSTFGIRFWISIWGILFYFWKSKNYIETRHRACMRSSQNGAGYRVQQEPTKQRKKHSAISLKPSDRPPSRHNKAIIEVATIAPFHPINSKISNTWDQIINKIFVEYHHIISKPQDVPRVSCTKNSSIINAHTRMQSQSRKKTRKYTLLDIQRKDDSHFHRKKKKPEDKDSYPSRRLKFTFAYGVFYLVVSLIHTSSTLNEIING